MTDTAFHALTTYIDAHTVNDTALVQARHDAEEFSIPIPDPIIGDFISALATDTTAAIAVTPAAAVTGLYILRNQDPKSVLTCIDPDSEHRTLANQAFTSAGYRNSRFRFLVANPLEVMGRLADSSYQLIVADVPVLDLSTFIDAAWPLLAPKGMLVLPDLLLDGTVGDESRRDRETAAAREADAKLAGLEDAVLARLPLGSGLVLAVKRSPENLTKHESQ